MVSNFRYYSFKELNLRGRVPFLWAIGIMLGFAILFTNPPFLLFTLFVLYALSGPALTVYRLKRRRNERKHSPTIE
jgi:CDP-diacylglycerol--serine O-phosphatidyltransferase